MTYCSAIMHQQTQKIEKLEAEIQQLKVQLSEGSQLYEDTLKELILTQKQVEAAKTWVNDYCLGCPRFKQEQCNLKKPSSCTIKQLREVLESAQNSEAQL